MTDREGEDRLVIEEKAKILIVEDEKVNIDVLVGLLNKDYRIVVAKNGEQAIKRLEKPPLPDLILLDIMMPGLDGYEVCRRIKNNPKTNDIPVIFITGKNDEQDEAKGFQAGAVDYIVKPVRPLITLARVKTHIELKRRGDMLELLAGHDGLTGIPNRRRFDQTLDAEWKRSVRHGHEISLVMMDIDYFKFYNDLYGHTAGDECLRKVAGAIARVLSRNEDLAARYGGEEFAFILPETSNQGALALADRVSANVNALQIPHASSRISEYVTVSIGLATIIPTKGDRVLDFVEMADQALYRAKEKGRNQAFNMNDDQSGLRG